MSLLPHLKGIFCFYPSGFSTRSNYHITKIRISYFFLFTKQQLDDKSFIKTKLKCFKSIFILLYIYKFTQQKFNSTIMENNWYQLVKNGFRTIVWAPFDENVIMSSKFIKINIEVINFPNTV